ncbi:MAG: putative porin [Gammaproteobacteria bacterium]|nr:putative porin [Gammaproteobacteria bacterium]
MTAAICYALALQSTSAAAAQDQLGNLKDKVYGLLDDLVAQGILAPEKAAELSAPADVPVESVVAAEPARPTPVAARGIEEEIVQPVIADAGRVIRVPYVPEFVKDEIRTELRNELREDVMEDVIQTAAREHWGTPEALPGWLQRMSWFGDFRLRGDFARFADENLGSGTYIDFQAINDQQRFLTNPETFYNFTENRERLRMRVRLGLNVAITDKLAATFRIATGSLDNPVSLNQTMGDAWNNKHFNLEQANLTWRFGSTDWLTLRGGRMKQPFFSTDLVWDNDVNFDGFTAHLKFDYGSKLLGTENSAVYLMAGAFPLSITETEIDDGQSNDKWLWAGQIGINQSFGDDTTFKLAAAYYHFSNIVGQLNLRPLQGFPDSRLLDWTAPGLVAKGNTMYAIKPDEFGNPVLFGLASDYHLVNITGQIDLGYWDPFHIVLTGDVIRNIGYNEDDVLARTGYDVRKRADGWSARLDLGAKDISRLGDWRLFASYKYLQRDAMLDAYAESNFHQGGTNAKGWVLGGFLGVADDTYIGIQYFTADAIDGWNENLGPGTDDTPLGIDVITLDLMTHF